MSRTLKITALVVAIGLVPLLIVGVLVKQRESDRAAVDSALVSRANVQAAELEAGFARGRTVALLMAGNPSFGDFYARPGTREQKVAAQGPDDRSRARGARLPREALSGADRRGVLHRPERRRERARRPRHEGAPVGALGRIQECFLQAFVRADVWVASTSRRPMSRRDTGEWVIANTTPIAGPTGAIAAIIHFELTIDSFRTAAAQFSGGGEVVIVDAATGAVVVNSRRPQLIGAKLGDPSDRRFAGLAGARGLVDRGNSRLAYRTVGGGHEQPLGGRRSRTAGGRTQHRPDRRCAARSARARPR